METLKELVLVFMEKGAPDPIPNSIAAEPFGLIRRQAAFFARVMDYLSTLPSQIACLPCCGEPFGLIRRQTAFFARVMDYLSTPLAKSLPSLSETKTLCRKAEAKKFSRKTEVQRP